MIIQSWMKHTVMFQDYMFLELLLASTYQPQNHYCYVLDSKADPVFKQRLRSLAACLPNVHIAAELDMDFEGKHIADADFACMKLLAKPEVQWYYVTLLEVSLVVFR